MPNKVAAQVETSGPGAASDTGALRSTHARVASAHVVGSPAAARASGTPRSVKARRASRGRPAMDSGVRMRSTSPPNLRDIERRLATALERAGLGVAASQRRALARYVALLAQWNRAYSLTAVREPFAMIDRHVLDSLTALEFLVGARLLDAGTGAGLPGLVLAIMRPDIRCTLLDPVRKKTRFCAHAAMTLELYNVEVASERLAAHRPAHRYSTVISRAALTLADLVAGARPLLEASGRIVAMKGPRPEAELGEIPEREREGLEIRVEPAAIGPRSSAATLVLMDLAGHADGVAAQGDVTIGQPSTPRGPGPASGLATRSGESDRQV